MLRYGSENATDFRRSGVSVMLEITLSIFPIFSDAIRPVNGMFNVIFQG